MNANHDFQIGKDHLVCQDFALSGVINNLSYGYAIVSDGCSASPDTDFGSRILAFAARESLTNPYGLYHPDVHRGRVIETLFQTTRLFRNLHPQALDATLLIALVTDTLNNGKEATIFMYGDGIAYCKTKAGVRTIHVAYEMKDGDVIKTAPDYLSYYLDKDRRARYEAANPEKIITRDGQFARAKAFETVVANFKNLESGDVIGLASDGVNSFRRANDEDIPWEEVVKECFAFKTTEGVFVTRRLKAYKRQCAKEGITHSDDISVAAIVI